MQLRPYQTQAIDDVRQAMIDGARSVLLQLPTGAGKTVIFSQITAACRDKGHRALILVHRRELIDQASRKLLGLDVPHGFIAAGYRTSNQAVQIASVQTLVKRLRLLTWEPSIIIIDEAHHSLAATYRKIFEHWPKAFRIGVSATPCRLDGRGLKHAFDTLVSGPSVRQLTADGYLCPAKLYAPPVKADFSKLRAIGGDFPAGKLSERMNKPAITGDVIGHYKRLALDEKAIAFCCDTKHAESVAASFRNAGISAQTLLGTTPAAQREALVQEFAEGKVQVLATVDVVSEGFDCPDAGCAILLRRTMSEALYLQQVGRVLRPAAGKPNAVILDHVGNIALHGFPDDDRQWTLQDRPSRARDRKPCAAVRQCPDCYAAFKPAPVCPCCGHEFAVKQGARQMVDGELVELTRELKIGDKVKTDRSIWRNNTVSPFHPLGEEFHKKTDGQIVIIKEIERRTPRLEYGCAPVGQKVWDEIQHDDYGWFYAEELILIENNADDMRREAAAERADKRAKRRQVTQARSLQSLLAIARERGYSPGWAYKLHAARGGR